jgi:hypothetical protein
MAPFLHVSPNHSMTSNDSAHQAGTLPTVLNHTYNKAFKVPNQ